MIESIRLRNFQRWRKLHLEFSKRVTTIIGATEAGKSTALRALKWLTLNQFSGPAGDFIHWDAKSAKVTVCVDGHTIDRYKNRSTTNTFHLDGKEFKSFGAGKVPDPISDLLLLTEANFQGQLDQHFWFSQTAGEVSRELNQIINLGSIDEALSNIASQVSNAKKEVDVGERRLTQSIKDRNDLKWIEGVDSSLLSLEKQQKRIDKSNLVISRLTHAIESTIQSRDTVSKRGREQTRASELVRIASRSIDYDKQTTKLFKLITRLESARVAVNRRIGILPDPTSIAKIERRITKLQTLITSLEQNEENLCQWQAREQKRKRILSTASKGICPICGKNIKE